MILLKGTIDDNLQPLVDDVFVVSEEGNVPVTVILDTGFNGECCLPARYKDKMTLQPVGTKTVELGDGSEITKEVYLGESLINYQPYFVEILFTDSEYGMLGMALLVNRVATFDLKEYTFKVEF